MDMARMQAVADKTRAFYETNTAGCALLKVKEIATQPQPALCLTDYNFPKDMRCYLDDRAARLLHAMALRDGLADDTLPALAPWYGIAEHSAFLGGKVTFGEDTSWQDPVLEDAFELSSMGIRVDAEALKRQLAVTGDEDRLKLEWHQALLRGEMPQTIGGGIGQSRLTMLLLQLPHIGQVQCGVWPQQVRDSVGSLL